MSEHISPDSTVKEPKKAYITGIMHNAHQVIVGYEVNDDKVLSREQIVSLEETRTYEFYTKDNDGNEAKVHLLRSRSTGLKYPSTGRDPSEANNLDNLPDIEL